MTVALTVDAEEMQRSAVGRAAGTFETNRSGFSVLHPINGVARHHIRVGHSDGSNEDLVFSELIAL
ncbi:hypothetical protein [Algicella marina]|uniref:hypothetical protein n=1 Tax=Algicella marina TaxID=2683284 RepID=UPI0024DF8F1B|nr:hypothetical protein [Algicella marina]